MRNLLLLATAVMGLALTGCTNGDGTGTGPVNPLTSPNVQRSSINSAGQVATSILLDNSDGATLPATMAELTGCLNDAQGTLNGTLTVGTIGPILAAKIPGKYGAYITQALVFAGDVSVPTAQIGAENLAKIKEFFDGSLYRLARYDMTGHRELMENPEALCESLGIVPQFYAHKRVMKETKLTGTCPTKK